jgi:hypothetical protein
MGLCCESGSASRTMMDLPATMHETVDSRCSPSASLWKRSADGSPRNECCSSVSPASFEMVTCLSSEPRASSPSLLHAPPTIFLACLPMILCFLSVRLSYRSRLPFAVPIASSGIVLDQRRYVRSFIIVSSVSSRPWLASQSFTMGEPCCRIARVSPCGSQSSCRHFPFPSSGMFVCGTPCLLKIFTMRLEPHVARKAPCGCHLKTTPPLVWYCDSTANKDFCAPTADATCKRGCKI